MSVGMDRLQERGDHRPDHGRPGGPAARRGARLYGLDKATALALASTCVDVRVTQVANQTWGVHAVLPDGLLSYMGTTA